MTASAAASKEARRIAGDEGAVVNPSNVAPAGDSVVLIDAYERPFHPAIHRIRKSDGKPQMTKTKGGWRCFSKPGCQPGGPKLKSAWKEWHSRFPEDSRAAQECGVEPKVSAGVPTQVPTQVSPGVGGGVPGGVAPPDSGAPAPGTVAAPPSVKAAGMTLGILDGIGRALGDPPEKVAKDIDTTMDPTVRGMIFSDLEEFYRQQDIGAPPAGLTALGLGAAHLFKCSRTEHGQRRIGELRKRLAGGGAAGGNHPDGRRDEDGEDPPRKADGAGG